MLGNASTTLSLKKKSKEKLYILRQKESIISKQSMAMTELHSSKLIIMHEAKHGKRAESYRKAICIFFKAACYISGVVTWNARQPNYVKELPMENSNERFQAQEPPSAPL